MKQRRWEDAWRDESWEAIRYKVHIKRDDGAQGAEVGSFMADVDDNAEDPYSDRGRAGLAAQAPAMARLLLDAEWASLGNYGSCSQCPWCDSENKPKHYAACPWVVTLVAAGILTAVPVENGYVLTTQTIVAG